MKKDKYHAVYLAVFVCLALMGVFVPQIVLAGNPYICGYFDSYPALATERVLASHRFMVTASQIPSNSSLGAVVSVAGTDSSGDLSGWIYQNGVALWSCNNVSWCPQAYSTGRGQWNPGCWTAGTGDYMRYYTRIDYQSNQINFRVYAYDTYGWYNNIPTYTFNQSKTTTDRWLLVGRSAAGTIKLFQFGVESQNQRVMTTNWKVVNDLPCYYTGTSWQYLPAKVAYGPTAITSAGGLAGYVGNANYTGVNLYHTQADEVIWRYTGSTVANGTTLWSGSGTVSDSRTAPYQ